MRMRYKKHLEERMDAISDVLLHREVEEFYRLTEQEKNFVVNPHDVFGNDNPLYLELGCGKGAFSFDEEKPLDDISSTSTGFDPNDGYIDVLDIFNGRK